MLAARSHRDAASATGSTRTHPLRSRACKNRKAALPGPLPPLAAHPSLRGRAIPLVPSHHSGRQPVDDRNGSLVTGAEIALGSLIFGRDSCSRFNLGFGNEDSIPVITNH